MASPLNVANAIINNLSAGSALGACTVGKDYAVLERNEISAVVGWSKLVSSVNVFGGSRQRIWTHSIQVYIKDNTNASVMMDSNLTVIPKIVSSLESDLTLQNTVDAVNQIRAVRRPGDALEIGELVYLTIDIEVDTLEFT